MLPKMAGPLTIYLNEHIMFLRVRSLLTASNCFTEKLVYLLQVQGWICITYFKVIEFDINSPKTSIKGLKRSPTTKSQKL